MRSGTEIRNFLSSEGVLIFPVKSNHAPYRAPHRAPYSSSCSPQGLATVKSGHSRSRSQTALLNGFRFGSPLTLSRLFAILLLAAAGAMALAQSLTIEQIRVIGNRRIPKETIVARLFTHVGDTYDPVSIERDFNSLWNTSYFEDLRIEREDSEKGVILNIYVKEKPNIREINYKGLNSITQSDILDRFKKEKVELTVDSQYDPTRIKKAESVIKEMEAEHGHQFATIKTEVKTIPPASVQVNFNVKEGPVVKVGKIQFTGNTHIG